LVPEKSPTQVIAMPAAVARAFFFELLQDLIKQPQHDVPSSVVRSLVLPKFRDHVNFDARAEWHLRHTDGTARMDAPLAEHLNK